MIEATFLKRSSEEIHYKNERNTFIKETERYVRNRIIKLKD